MSLRAVFVALAVLAGLLPASAQEKLPVVATFSILGDFVKNVGGDRVALEVLVGPNGDAHVYSPSPADAKKLAAAKVVFTNGLRLEGWIDRLVKAAGSRAAVVIATKGIAPIEAAERAGHKQEHGPDPHAWQSVVNAKIYVANVRDGLIAVDPAGRDIYEKNARDYLSRLDALEAEVTAQVARIAPERRRIITSHDAFGYFRAAYGVEFIAPQGVSTDAEASAKDVAKIIRQIRTQRIPAVFLENISDPRLLQRIADETGARIGGTLYSDALSDEKGPAASYIDMMRHNVKELAAALTS
jgi:zinc/manganese transport system substrate-binding protein